MSVKLSGRIVTTMNDFLGNTMHTSVYVCDGNGHIYGTDTIAVFRWTLPYPSDPLGFEGKFFLNAGEPFTFSFAEDKYAAAQPVYLCETECILNPTGTIKNGNKFFDRAEQLFDKHCFDLCEDRTGDVSTVGTGVFDGRYIEKCAKLSKALMTHDKGKVPIMQMTTYNLGMICTMKSISLGKFEVAVAGRTRE